MSIFRRIPRTVEQAITPLRTMLEDLEEIAEAATRQIAQNDAAVTKLTLTSIALDQERGRSTKVRDALRTLMGDDDA